MTPGHPRLRAWPRRTVSHAIMFGRGAFTPTESRTSVVRQLVIDHTRLVFGPRQFGRRQMPRAHDARAPGLAALAFVQLDAVVPGDGDAGRLDFLARSCAPLPRRSLRDTGQDADHSQSTGLMGASFVSSMWRNESRHSMEQLFA